MGDAEQIVTEISLNQEQLEDLAWLLAETRNVDDLERFADRFLGAGEAKKAAGNEVSNPNAFALKIVQEWQKKDLIADVVDTLIADGHPSGPMRIGLNHILDGKRVNSNQALQALLNEYEPFLSTADMIDLLPKVARRVCAIGLADPHFRILGSGFLIAPDIVITNFHVVESYLEKDGQGGFTQKQPGEKIFIYFDYMRAPKPKVPPGNVRGTICVNAATQWYVYGREELPNDGTKNCPVKLKNNELDYVLIRLARPVGALSAREGGGSVRGWLELPDAIELDSKNPPRILVVQHPEAMPQLFDIGYYKGEDPSGTRVWYSVSTAKGSSGGAAIGTDGRLIALHNAEVKDENGGANRVNQGVRIDFITKDIGNRVTKEIPPDDKKLLWSLTDNFKNPEPIIGRVKFRDHITQMHRSNTDRVLEVRGTPPTGLNFSIKLLNRIRPSDVRVAEFAPTDLQKPILEGFIPRLIGQLNLSGYTGEPPELLKTEAPNRWVGDVAKWLLNGITKDHETNKTKYPAWVVINTVVAQGQTFMWGPHLEDLIAALLGRRNDQNEALDVPQLRWLFLATPNTNLPLASIKPLQENLDNDTDYDRDFEDCYLNAYRSIDRESPMKQGALRPVAAVKLDEEQELANPRPPRKVLALYIRKLLKHAPKPSSNGNE